MAPYLKDKALKKKIRKLQRKNLSEGTNSNLVDGNVNGLDNSFDSLKDIITEGTMKAIKDMKFQTMTEIQLKAIPSLLKGYDIRATAKTGSGKTLAFLIPVVEWIVKLRYQPRNGTGAIIITPTRELALQTYGVLMELMTYHNQTFHLVMGGTVRNIEADKLSKGVNILVATPGRLLDHLQNASYFNYQNLSCLVIDEADQILTHGFQKEMQQIQKLIPSHRQTMLFSATKDHRTDSIAQLFLKEKPLEIDIQSSREEVTAEGLEQTYLLCPRERRFLLLYKFIKRHHKKKVMIFFSTYKAVEYYHDLLNFIGIPVMCIHGEQKPNHRIRTYVKFCRQESGVLLCTNIASRGLDFPSVHWIVQYDPPDDPKEYIHRVGRTARAGGTGSALLFLTEEEVDFVHILRAFKVNMNYMEIDWSKVPLDIQNELEEIVKHNKHFKKIAREAFIASCRSYNSHSFKKIFDINKLDLKKMAKCFHLLYIPSYASNKTWTSQKKPIKRKQFFDTEAETETGTATGTEIKIEEKIVPKHTKFED